jgi:hypothetical protein
MPPTLTAEDIAIAFADTAAEQRPGTPILWQRVADRLNCRLDELLEPAPLPPHLSGKHHREQVEP